MGIFAVFKTRLVRNVPNPLRNLTFLANALQTSVTGLAQLFQTAFYGGIFVVAFVDEVGDTDLPAIRFAD